MARNASSASEAAGVPGYRQAIPLIMAELHRSQRYEHPLSVLVLSPDDRADTKAKGRSAGNASDSLDSTYTGFFLLGSLLRDAMRESDIIAYSPEDRLYVTFLSESDDVAARHAARRFSAAFYERASRRLRAGVAQFPVNGFTIDDLVDQARMVWRERPLSDDAFPTSADGTNG